MVAPRIIPMLTVIGQGLFRTVKFKKPSYVGDPVNAVKIFNDKEVDELIIMDIGPNESWQLHQIELMEELASEAFMPMAYGGKIRSTKHVEQIFKMGFEKVVLNTSTVDVFTLLNDVSKVYGAQSVVVSIDVASPFFRRPQVAVHGGSRLTGLDPIAHAENCQNAGAGEIIIRSISHDGVMGGYDLDLIRSVSRVTSVPLVAAGGAGSYEHFSEALCAGANSVAAGSLFVYQGKHRAVLINYPEHADIEKIIKKSQEYNES